MQKHQTAETTLFVAGLNDPAYDEVYSYLPEVFVEQARQGKENFYLDDEMVSDSVYSGKQNSDSDLFRIVCEDPKILDDEEGGVSFKLRLSGLMDYSNGEMIKHTRGSQGDENSEITWLKGFRSNTLSLTPEDVQIGMVSESDYQLLVKYAHTWAEIVKKGGERAPYSKEFSRTRLWLTAAGPDFLFNFLLELRQNPQTGEDALGIFNISWRDAVFIGSGSGATPTRPGRAKTAKSLGTATDIASPPRMVKPTETVEDTAESQTRRTRGGKK